MSPHGGPHSGTATADGGAWQRRHRNGFASELSGTGSARYGFDLTWDRFIRLRKAAGPLAPAKLAAYAAMRVASEVNEGALCSEQSGRIVLSRFDELESRNNRTRIR